MSRIVRQGPFPLTRPLVLDGRTYTRSVSIVRAVRWHWDERDGQRVLKEGHPVMIVTEAQLVGVDLLTDDDNADPIAIPLSELSIQKDAQGWRFSIKNPARTQEDS